MGEKIANYLVGLKTILGAAAQLIASLGLIIAGLLDAINKVEGSGEVKMAVGLGFAGIAIGQLGLRYAKKTVELNNVPTFEGTKLVGKINPS